MPVKRRTFVSSLAAFALAGCGKQDSGTGPSAMPTPIPRPTPIPTPTPDRFTLIAVGDMGDCSRNGTEVTARIVEHLIKESQPDIVRLHTLGDHAYPNGNKEAFARCFEPAWGQFVPVIHPCVGNHDVESPNPHYFTIFGERATGNGKDGYYSYTEQSWLVIVLNSEILGDRTKRTEQAAFVRRELAAHPGKPVIGVWHRPRFGHGENGDTRNVQEFLDMLAGRLVVTMHGHEHYYERFHGVNGFRSFIIGTGGSRLYKFRNVRCELSEFRYLGVIEDPVMLRERETFGVARFRFQLNGTYSWEYWVLPDGAAAPIIVDSDVMSDKKQRCP